MVKKNSVSFILLGVLAIVSFAGCKGLLSENIDASFRASHLSPRSSFKKTNVFIGAHADDQILFMTTHLDASIDSERSETVLIVSTAGDAGRGHGDYSIAREEALEAAIDFAGAFILDNDYGDFTYTNIGEANDSFVTINGKNVYKKTWDGGVHVYFLRLPDGSGNGSGYESTGSQSVQKLLNGTIENISTLDGMNTYTKQELQDMFQSIYRLHHNPQLHVVDPYTPQDHSDHIATGEFARRAYDGEENMVLYQQYHTSSLPINVNPYQRQTNLFIMEAHWQSLASQGLRRGKGLSGVNDRYIAWTMREYSREIPGPNYQIPPLE